MIIVNEGEMKDASEAEGEDKYAAYLTAAFKLLRSKIVKIRRAIMTLVTRLVDIAPLLIQDSKTVKVIMNMINDEENLATAWLVKLF